MEIQLIKPSPARMDYYFVLSLSVSESRMFEQEDKLQHLTAKELRQFANIVWDKQGPNNALFMYIIETLAYASRMRKTVWAEVHEDKNGRPFRNGCKCHIPRHDARDLDEYGTTDFYPWRLLGVDVEGKPVICSWKERRTNGFYTCTEEWDELLRM